MISSFWTYVYVPGYEEESVGVYTCIISHNMELVAECKCLWVCIGRIAHYTHVYGLHKYYTHRAHVCNAQTALPSFSHHPIIPQSVRSFNLIK